MKKFLLSLLLLVLVGSAQAQNAYSNLPGRWRLGLNMGAIWTGSDVKAIPGLGGGFNLEKILNKRNDVFLGFSLGFRYLGGKTFGQNTGPQYNMQDNSALNGTIDSTVNYVAQGHFYANHKTFIQEGNLELKMNFPSLERATGIIFHVWGGVGICKYKTWIDAKDAKGNMYDFSSFKQQEVSQSDLTKIFDGSYETLADGSGRNGTLAFIPSVGAGIGYHLGKHVALVFEHKISFPGTDKLEGFVYSGASCKNDFYHYTSVNLVFTFYASSGSTHTTDNTVYTNTTGSQTVTPNNAQVNTHTVTPYTPPTVYPPNVIITYPANYYSSQYDNVNVSATIQNIKSSQQIIISLNGNPLQHFSFNPSNGTLNFQSFLALGNNNFVVSATNGGGTASDNVIVIYNPQFTNTGNIVIPTNTTVPTNTVSIHTNTVVTTNTVTVNTNTVSINTNTVVTTNTVSVNTNTVSINTNTVVPTNTVTISTNTVTINTNTTTGNTNTVSVNTSTVSITPTNTAITTSTTTATGQSGKPPVIQIINPAVSGQVEPGDVYNVSASILNINSANEVSILVNNVAITLYTYSNHNKMLNFNAPLQDGHNYIVINATNAYGTDSKNTIINHHAGKPPKVAISNPNVNPYISQQANVLVNGFVHYVNGSADVKVTLNGNAVPFNFNPATGATDVNLTLSPENNQLIITGTNQYGSDAQSINLILQKSVETGTVVVTNTTTATTATTTSGSSTGGGLGHVGGGVGGSHSVPEITVTTPVSDPFYTNNSSISASANINLVLNATDVSVSNNGAPVSSYYDVNFKKLSFSAPLLSGNNAFIITAHNAYGTSSKTINVIYTPVNTNININSGGNQQSNPIKTGNPVMQPKTNNGTAPIITNPIITPKNGGGENNGGGRPSNNGNVQPTSNPNAPRTINTATVAPMNNGGGGRTKGGG